MALLAVLNKQSPQSSETAEASVSGAELEGIINRHATAVESLVACPWVTTASSPDEHALLENLSRTLNLAPGGAPLVSGGRTMLGEPELTLYLLEGTSARIFSVVCGERPVVTPIVAELLAPERREELAAFISVPTSTAPEMTAPTMAAPQMQILEVQQQESPAQQVSFLEFEQRVLAREAAVMDLYESALAEYEASPRDERLHWRAELDQHCSGDPAHLDKSTASARYGRELYRLSLDRTENAIAIQTKLIGALETLDKRAGDLQTATDTLQPILLFYQTLSRQRRRTLLKELQELERGALLGFTPSSEAMEFFTELKPYFEMVGTCNREGRSLPHDLMAELKAFDVGEEFGVDVEPSAEVSTRPEVLSTELLLPSEDDTSTALLNLFHQLTNWNKKRGERGYVDGTSAHEVRMRIAVLFGFEVGTVDEPLLDIAVSELRGGRGYAITLKDSLGGTTTLVWHPHQRTLTMTSNHEVLAGGFAHADENLTAERPVTLPPPFEALGKFLLQEGMTLVGTAGGIDVRLDGDRTMLPFRPDQLFSAGHRNRLVAKLYEIAPALQSRSAQFASQHRAMLEAPRKRPLDAMEQAQLLRSIIEFFQLSAEKRTFGLRVGLGFGMDKPVIIELRIDGEAAFRLQYTAPSVPLTVMGLEAR